MTATTLRLEDAAGLDAQAVLAIARGELVPELDSKLIHRLDARRSSAKQPTERKEPSGDAIRR